jgi:hypothetical protein
MEMWVQEFTIGMEMEWTFVHSAFFHSLSLSLPCSFLFLFPPCKRVCQKAYIQLTEWPFDRKKLTKKGEKHDFTS